MGKNKITIHLPPTPVYFGGDIINGVVELNVQSSLNSRGIRMLFAGFERTSVTKQSGKKSTTYHQKRVFVSHRYDFAGTPRHLRNEREAKTDVVEPGVYRWPFALQLPLYAPTVCDFYNGWIKYIFTAYVDIPKAFDLKFTVPINVAGELFSRSFYLAPVPPITEDSKESFLFASGEMKMKATIFKQNLFIGDVIPIHIEVNNESGKKVDSIKIYVSQLNCFTAHGHQEVSNDVSQAWRVKLPHTVQENSKEVFDVEYTIPDVLPSIHTSQSQEDVLWQAKLVFIQYTLVVRLDIPFATDLEVKFPVKIMKPNPRYAQPVYPPQGTYAPNHAQNGASSPTVSLAKHENEQPVSLEKHPQHTVSLEKHSQQQQPEVVSLTKKTEALSLNHAPPAGAAVYPQVEGYKYPEDIQPLLLDLGEHQLPSEDLDLLD